jgi:hypothetical protein
MRKALILLLCLAGCAPGGGNASRAEHNVAAGSPRAPVQTQTLTGRYETLGARPSQLCIVEQGQRARFGLVTWQGERSGCSGAGSAVRTGATLRLTMDGESACAIEARIADGRVAFAANAPRGCSYYCAPGAPLASLVFAKTGGTRGDALRARDLVGDPLCG